MRFPPRPASDEVKQSVEKDLTKGVRAFKALAKFDPYIAGKELTLADCAGFVHLPLGERPAFRKVNEDRKAAQAALMAKP